MQKAGKLTKSERSYAQRITKKGWLIEKDGGFTVAPPPKVEPDLIWLPNELVTGAAHEIPPLELVRQMQDVMTLRLLIDMYHAHNLREDGGVSRQCMWKKYDRVKLNERAQFVVWGFRSAGEWVNWDSLFTSTHRREKLTREEIVAGKKAGVDFFHRSAQLHDVGLFEWVPHLVESDDETGEIIHPVGNGRSDAIEDRLGQAALHAGRVLITHERFEWAANQGIQFLVPVPRHVANVQMIGIARLRYRPRTGLTAAWWAELHENAEKHLARYAEIANQSTRIAV